MIRLQELFADHFRMARVICVFLIIFLYGCFGKIFSNNVTEQRKISSISIQENKGEPPATYDWRDYGVVTPVKNQSDCKAGWAFSVAGAIESQFKMFFQYTSSLSEQFLIDCNTINATCAYHEVLSVFGDILMGTNGVVLNISYRPYDGRTDVKCARTGQEFFVPIYGFKKVFSERYMMKQLHQYGPLSASINTASMEKYKPNATLHGIDTPSDEDCSPNDLNHAVLVVGYDEYVSEDNKTVIPYWIIKNSWGEDWGHNGYYYLVRGRNACGIGKNVGVPFVV